MTGEQQGEGFPLWRDCRSRAVLSGRAVIDFERESWPYTLAILLFKVGVNGGEVTGIANMVNRSRVNYKADFFL